MGVDLTLVPDQVFAVYGIDNFESPVPENIFPHTKLDLTRHRELFNLIEKSNCRPLNNEMGWYFDDGIKYVRNDMYDQPLTWTTAGEILAALNAIETSKWNKAVGKLLESLLPQTPIVLWWH